MDVHPGNEKSLGWTCNDFSDGEVKLEVLCIRFGSVESKSPTRTPLAPPCSSLYHPVRHFVRMASLTS